MSGDWLPDPLVGSVFEDRFHIETALPGRGIGAVYRARQLKLDRLVTVKLLRSDGDSGIRKRFMQEMRATSAIEHPNSVRVYDFGATETGDLYLVMEHLPGRTLAQILRQGVLPARRVAQLGCQIAAALAAAHARGVVHRDLKPASILLVDSPDGQDWVKVVDFGLARLQDAGYSRLTASDVRLGTPAYMAPEYIMELGIDHRADLYALGVVLFEALVGKPPFHCKNEFQLLAQHVGEAPPYLSEAAGRQIPSWLEDLVMRLLAKDPDDRPQTAKEVIETLSPWLGSWRYAGPVTFEAEAAPDTVGNGRYVLKEMLGSGGMAGVWRAWDSSLKVWRAVKVLNGDLAAKADVLNRFDAEARMMARLEHPNVVRIYDVGCTDGRPWIAMELAEGGTLRDWVEHYGPMPSALAVDVIAQVARGLRAVHDAGVVHRDIKPQNVLVDPYGVCKLTDFGIAHDAQTEVTKTGTIIGTFGYMAPEQKIDAKDVDERADVYGLAATLVCLVTGAPPIDLFRSSFDPEVLIDVPKHLRTIVATACAYDRGQRYPDVDTFLEALARVKHVLPTLPPTTPSLVLGKRADPDQDTELHATGPTLGPQAA